MQSRINKIFKAIADPTRREIFHVLVLASTALSITQIAEQFDISRQGITKHIMQLHDAGMLDIQTKGREKYCKADLSALKELFQEIGEKLSRLYHEQFPCHSDGNGDP